MWYWIFIGIGIYVFLTIGFYAFQEYIFFRPKRPIKNQSIKFHFPVEEIFIKTDDQAELHAGYFKVDEPKGVLLFLHGNTGDIRKWQYYAKPFINEGFNVLIPDYRNYGKSRGKLSEKSFFNDADLFYNFLVKNWDEKKIIIYGKSLGTGIATYLAGKHHPKKLFLESPYYSFQSLHHRYFSWIPERLLRYHFRTDLYLPTVKCPVYFIHGKRDTLIPYENSIKLNQLIQNKGTTLFIPQGNHKNLDTFNEFNSFLHQHLINDSE